MMNITNAKLFPMGPRKLNQRAAVHWLRKTAFVGLTIMAGTAGAHEEPAVMSVKPQPVAQNIIPAQFAPTVFERKLSEGALDWAKGGAVQVESLLNQWETNGVTPTQAIELLNVLILTQSPMVVTTQQSLDIAVSQSNAAQSVLEIKTARNAEFFLRSHDTAGLTDRNVLAQAQIFALPLIQEADWRTVRAHWNRFASERQGEVSAPNPTQGEDFATARQHLVAAVQTAGVSGLRVPLPMWNSPQRIEVLAQRIEQANTQLQQLTGWSGKVLGVNNTLEISIMKPGDNCVTYQTPQGQIAISSSWEDLAHEWLHGMQAAVAQQQTGKEGLTKTFDISGEQQTHLQNTWAPVLTHLNDPTSVWQKNLNKYLNGDASIKPAHNVQWDDLRAARAYYTSPSETMAYAWGSYVQSQLPATSVLAPQSLEHNTADGVIAPTPQQAATQKNLWVSAFASLNSWWEGQQNSINFTTNLFKRRTENQTALGVPPVALKHDHINYK